MAATKSRKRRGAGKTADSRTASPATTSASNPKQRYELRSATRLAVRAPTGFLDIPAELRSHVYDMCLETYPSIKLHANQRVTSDCPLVRVNKQLRDEFMSRAAHRAPIVETLIKVFNFAHVIKFLNRLNDKAIQAFECPQNGPSSRSFVIRLQVSTKNDEGFEIEADTDELRRWLKRFEKVSKKGSKIDFTYVKLIDEWVNFGARKQLFIRMGLRSVWAWAGRWQGLAPPLAGPMVREGGKIYEALD